MRPFTHLHVHSHYSLLDGLSKTEELVERAKELGMTSLALTDHGVMYGTIEFYNTCREAGIKPIIGVEAYVAPRSMHEKEGKQDSNYYHLTLLATNDAGYKNLI
ncbi:MAG: PHP domain-containing protein, partial [Candidatus Doudnabacteria bacterium]|nr:PHP domain-containing protein [Candidatus Doudnabacteria bacterium]